MYSFPTRRFVAKPFRVGAVHSALSTALPEVTDDLETVEISLTKTFADGTEHSTSVGLAETAQVCDLASTSLSLDFGIRTASAFIYD